MPVKDEKSVLTHSKAKKHDQKFCSPDFWHGGDWGHTYADGSLTTIEGKITVEHVINVKIIDTERIQYYDFNYIQWIEKEKKLKVITNIPLIFEIFVTEFEIKIEINSI